MTFAATILTLHTEMFLGPLGVSLAGMACLDTYGTTRGLMCLNSAWMCGQRMG